MLGCGRAANEVETDMDWKMTSATEFNVAGVRKPLASAARIVKSGNRVVLDQDGSFIENKRTGERMEVRVKDTTFVFEVELTNGELEVTTVDSGAGAGVATGPIWGRHHDAEEGESPHVCHQRDPIKNLGRKLIQFRGIVGEGRTRTSGGGGSRIKRVSG